MMSLAKLILEAADRFEHVTVFTQDLLGIQTFLFKETGKWNISINEKWWPSFEHEKMRIGKTLDGYKIGLVNPESAEIGLNARVANEKIYFTKNPFDSIPEKTFIIKDHFSFPKLSKVSHFPPIIALQKEGRNLLLCPDGVHDYISLHDQFSMQGIEHSIETSGEIKAPHIVKSLSFMKDFSGAVVYGYRPFEELFKLNNLEKIVLVRPLDFFHVIRFEKVQKVMRCFTEMAEFGISPEYIGFKTFLHPDTVTKILQFMNYGGFVQRLRTDGEMISIYKKGTAPDSIEFHSIPEGTFKIHALIKHLQIAREDLFPLLKKYEKNGLIFSYLPTNNLKLWKMSREMMQSDFQTLIQQMSQEQSMIEDFIGNEEEKTNAFLEDRIQKHCINKKSEAILFNSGETIVINPNPQSFIP